MPDILSELSEVSILKKERIKEIARKIKENRKKLDNCAKHQFGEIDNIVPSNRVVCRNCKGFMSIIAISDYRDGYIAAGGNPDDICIFV